MMDNLEEQDFGGLPVLKKSGVSSKSEVTEVSSEDFGGLPILKKKDFLVFLEKHLLLQDQHHHYKKIVFQ